RPNERRTVTVELESRAEELERLDSFFGVDTALWLAGDSTVRELVAILEHASPEGSVDVEPMLRSRIDAMEISWKTVASPAEMVRDRLEYLGLDWSLAGSVLEITGR
ncbi:MAG: hypothetical protein KDC38_19120, partial [Planctomycetes bacterium]|nr:hypothetical protein [Planctomycetota bacterium]